MPENNYHWWPRTREHHRATKELLTNPSIYIYISLLKKKNMNSIEKNDIYVNDPFVYQIFWLIGWV